MLRRPFRAAAVGPRAMLLAAVLASFVAPLPREAAAARLLGFGGWYTDRDQALAGAGVQLDLGPFALVPNAEYLFVDGGTGYTLNLDAHWSLLPLPFAGAWAGGGIGRHVFDPDAGDRASESVVNVLAGVGFDAVPLKPFAQVKYVLMDGDDPFAVTFGIRF